MTINDNSTFYPNSTGAIVSWTYAGGTYTGSFINTPNQTQTLTPTSSGLITITLTVVHNGCTSVATTQILVVMPVAPITINPNPSCHGSPVFFSTVSGMAS